MGSASISLPRSLSLSAAQSYREKRSAVVFRIKFNLSQRKLDFTRPLLEIADGKLFRLARAKIELRANRRPIGNRYFGVFHARPVKCLRFEIAKALETLFTCDEVEKWIEKFAMILSCQKLDLKF